MKKYTVTKSDKTQVEIKGKCMKTGSGELRVLDSQNNWVACFAPGAWLNVVEKEDKGDE